MQSYNNTQDYDQRNPYAQTGYMQGLKESNERYGQTRTDPRTYARDRTGEDEILPIYSNSNVDEKLTGQNDPADLSEYSNRSPFVNEKQQYEIEDVYHSSIRSDSANVHTGSVTLNSQTLIPKGSAEMSDHKPIPGRPDVYNDYNNETIKYNKGMTDSDDVLVDPADNYEGDYTDRDFPGGGKSARQSLIGENPVMVKERKRCCCCSRKICVIITFIIFVVIAISLYFIWPRIPSVSVDGNQTTSLPDAKPIIRQQPPLVDLSINVQVLIDNRENWVPYKFNQIDVKVFDASSLSTFKSPIATGNVTHYTLPPRSISTLLVPIRVYYQPSKGNDPTFQDLVSACVKSSASTQKLLNFNIDLKLFIWGVDWIYKPEFSIPVSDFKCPYSLLAQ